jgi:hypothetical protein
MGLAKEKQGESQFEIEILEDTSFAEVIFYGSVTLELLNQSFMSLLKSPFFIHNMNACYNFCDATIETDMKNLEEHAQFVSENLETRGLTYQLALVSNETINRAFLSIYKLLISKTQVDAEVFSTKKQAELWLDLNH